MSLTACAALALAARPGMAGAAECLLAAPGFERARTASGACVACHDGTGAASVSGDHSHPVERSYADAWLRRRADLRPMPAVELVLAGGVVTCATCHDGRTGLPHRTAVPLARLCQGCHDR